MRRTARIFLATMVLLTASRAAYADFASIDPLLPFAVTARETVALPYVEDFEPPRWHTGPANQNGWQNAVSPDMPMIVGADLARGGSQTLRVADDPRIGPGFPGALYLSPFFSNPAGPLSISTRIRISNLGGADYYISPQSVALNLACARVRFAGRDPNGDGRQGDIEILDDVNGPVPGGIAFVPTGINYVPGEVKDVRIDFVGNNQINYFYAGQLFYTGSTLFNDITGLTCNGPQVDQLALADNQAQFFTTDNYADYDNIAITPEPATASLVMLVALVTRIRRR